GRFDGWYHGDVKWNFSDRVTGDMTLVGKWYAEGEEPEEIFHGGTPIGTEKIIHDFTQSGLSSKYFAITGEMHSKSNSGQTVEYDGKVYKGKGLVLDSSTEITFFTTTQSAKLVLLIRFYSENKKIIIDGVTYKSTPGMIEAQLKSGEHTVKGSGSDYLFAIIVIPEGESEIPIYTITIDPDNGSAVKTIVLTEGKQITEEELPTPTKEGYTFQGWVDEENNAITVPYTPTKSMTIKANWKKTVGENQYVITIDKQDGTEPVEKVIEAGTELTETDLPSTLTREGYIFQGWIDEEDNAITVPYTPTKSMTIRAKWKNDSTNPGPGPDDPIDPDEVGLHV
ncbi:MAG: InlB B-repeat-containing protein, partial [Acetatifactor sp.]|nr:InlB B-repeat-containing protein [Acetatifactor sp.]